MTQEKGVMQYQGLPMSIPELRTLAADFAKSGFFPDAKEAVQAVVKIQAGIEMGFGPVYSMTKIYIVKGRVMVSAEALGALVKRSGRYDYSVKTLTDTDCVLEFTDRDKVVYTSKFTMEDAKRAELVKQGGGWMTWPRAMLMSKALSQGARIVCPHIIAGVSTPEDFGVETTENGSPLITVEAEGIIKDTSGSVAMIAETQRKRIFAVAREKGWDDAKLHDYIFSKYVVNHLIDLTQEQAKEFIDVLVALSGKATTSTLEDASKQGNGEQVGSEAPATDEDAVTAESQSWIDLSWLKESQRKTHFTDATAISWLRSKANYQGLDLTGGLINVIHRMNKEQAAFLVAEIEDRLKMV